MAGVGGSSTFVVVVVFAVCSRGGLYAPSGRKNGMTEYHRSCQWEVDLVVMGDRAVCDERIVVHIYCHTLI